MNRCRTWIARRATRPELADYLQETPDHRPADDSTELQTAIRAAVDALRDEYREVFVLFHEQGQCYEEIAEAVGRPVGTVKTWLHRARLELLERVRTLGLVPDEPGDEKPQSRKRRIIMARPDEFDAVPPACRSTVDRLQRVLDGELPADALRDDWHLGGCRACRERIAAAKLMLSVLATPKPLAIPMGMTDAIVAAVKEDRYSRIRRRSYAVSVGAIAALAASFMFVTWLTKSPPQPPVMWDPRVPGMAKKPMRIGDELVKAGVALRDSSKPITEPVTAAPQLFTSVTDVLTFPNTGLPEVELPHTALGELPDAARAGLEPVTDTARKAFTRLMRDVSAVQVSAKPKS